MTDQPHTSPFDATRRVDEEGNEYWSARELSKLLGYSQWQKFQRALKDAIEACKQSGKEPSDDFTRVSEIVKAGATSKPKEDYHLSRYACYLVIQNADPEKPIVALGQTYFAVQTRRQELADELASCQKSKSGSSCVVKWRSSTNNSMRQRNGPVSSPLMTLPRSPITATSASMEGCEKQNYSSAYSNHSQIYLGQPR